VNVGCDRHGYILGMSIDSGNVHDSVAFYHLNLDYAYREQIETMVLDAGYSTAPICHSVHSEGKEIIVPRKRAASKGKGYYKKWQYEYNQEEDIYVCPLGCILRYSTTNKDGRKQYKSNEKQCKSCPHLKKCTQSRNCTKVIERHVWQEDLEESIKLQKSQEGKRIYDQRKQTVEREFGDGKRRHGLDYTLYRGHERVYDHTLLTFTGMNMKKLCTYYKKQKEKYAKKKSFGHQNEEVKRIKGQK
jgi:hypothetical protein